jgi:hypothetical protein
VLDEFVTGSVSDFRGRAGGRTRRLVHEEQSDQGA